MTAGGLLRLAIAAAVAAAACLAFERAHGGEKPVPAATASRGD